MELVVLLVTAFALGFIARALGLPALVGYLIAGFVLGVFGYELTAEIQAVADIGILLLLFGIGLKLDLRTLARPAVAATTFAQLAFAVVVLGGLLLGLGAFGLPLLADLDLGTAALIGFALSFSSTVFAVKALEQNNESSSLSGRLAVGVLILQDLLAVIFLAVAAGTWPSIWLVPAVVVLVLARPLLGKLLDSAGRGEILTMLGFALAIGIGTGLFGFFDAKPDLGALVGGVLLSGHPRAGELSDRLLGFKDLFLVGFFVSIGLAGVPDATAWVIGGILVLLLPLRGALSFWVLTRFRLRPRTAFQTSLTLATYSEFGLIVVAAGVSAGLIGVEWIAVLGLVVSVSFIAGSPINGRRHSIYGRWHDRLGRFERRPIIFEDGVIDCGQAEIVIFGMGRIGTGAYDALVAQQDRVVSGIDRRQSTVDEHRAEGRLVTRGDALDRDFWDRVKLHPEISMVVAAMSNHSANLELVSRVNEYLPWVRVAAIATWPDEIDELRDAGVTVARNLYEEAGQGLAEDAIADVFGEGAD